MYIIYLFKLRLWHTCTSYITCTFVSAQSSFCDVTKGTDTEADAPPRSVSATTPARSCVVLPSKHVEGPEKQQIVFAGGCKQRRYSCCFLPVLTVF